jgi:hypothetical protein
MSGNRSIQAAQRRRAGPTNNEPPIPGRNPQTSINSAQIFANQARTGPGPNIPTSRLGGQQESMQKQMAQGQNNDKLSSVSKMTIPQAITLITLRLGVVENKLLQMPEMSNFNMNNDIDRETDVDMAVLETIMSRLESLEKRSASTNGVASTPELNSIKQQFETLKQAVVQTKTSTTNLVKENVLLKTQMEELKRDFSETKELLETLQKITFENSQRILNLTTNSNDDYSSENNEQSISNLDELQNTELQMEELQENGSDNDHNEFIGTDLKKMIESELNVTM